MHNHLLQ